MNAEFFILFVFLNLLHENFIKCIGVEIDNALIDVPQIDCHADTIEMRFKTKKRFKGKIYVQGHYSNPDCRVDYSHTNAQGEPIGGIRLHHGACDMDRQRMLQPEGMQFSTVLVISFHPLFVTSVDRAFHINCLYQESIKSVEANLDVSPITPMSIQYDMRMPVCKYTIRKDELDGPILHYAQVGDQVVHRWECDSDDYGMLVHTCYVEDGQGNQELVIDEKGCHVQGIALGDPTYVEALNLAYRESNVFRFPDHHSLRFACEIKLCVKHEGGCNGITPPVCDKDLKDDDLNLNYVNDDTIKILNSSQLLNDALNKSIISKKIKRQTISKNLALDYLNKKKVDQNSKFNKTFTATTDLISQYVYVLDNIEKFNEGEKLQGRKVEKTNFDYFSYKNYVKKTSICLSPIIITLFIIILVGLTFTLSIFLVTNAFFKQLRSKKTIIETFEKRISPFNFVFKQN